MVGPHLLLVFKTFLKYLASFGENSLRKIISLFCREIRNLIYSKNIKFIINEANERIS